jgi:hypothetical protein
MTASSSLPRDGDRAVGDGVAARVTPAGEGWAGANGKAPPGWAGANGKAPPGWAGANGKAPPVVLAIRAMLAGRPRIDIVAVVDALLKRFQDEDEDGVVAQCVASTRAFRAATGRTSSTGYVGWQNAQPRPHPHPSLSKLRQVLGGAELNWNVCKIVAYGDAALDPTTRRLRKERATTPADCEEAGRLWLADRARRAATGPLSLHDFVSFCRMIAAGDDRPLARVPLSALALQRHFGGWFAFLLRIGVLVDDSVVASSQTSTLLLDEEQRARRRDMVLAVRLYAATCDGPLRRDAFFAFFRERSGDGDPASGSPDYSLSKLFGTFRGLLVCAGLGERHHDPGAPIDPPDWERGNARTDTHDEPLLAFVDAAARANGGDATAPQLTAFAVARRRAAQHAGTKLNCPSVPTIVRRFGAVSFALAQLGYISDTEAQVRSTRRYPEENLERALLGAMLEYTPACTQSQYRAFADRARAEGELYPAAHFPIANGLGGGDFEAAKREVMRRHPEIKWPDRPAPGWRSPCGSPRQR